MFVSVDVKERWSLNLLRYWGFAFLCQCLVKKSGVKNGAVLPLGVGITFLWWVCFRRKRIPKKEIRKNFLQQNFSNLHQENRSSISSNRSEFKRQKCSLSVGRDAKILAFSLFNWDCHHINKLQNLKLSWVGEGVLGFVRMRAGRSFHGAGTDQERELFSRINLYKREPNTTFRS